MDRQKVARELVALAKELMQDSPRDRKAYPAFGYATLTFKKNLVKFTITDGQDKKTSGSQPYRDDPAKAIRHILDVIESWDINPSSIEVIN